MTCKIVGFVYSKTYRGLDMAYGETRAHFIVLELLEMGVNQMEIERRTEKAGHKVAQAIVSVIKLKKSNRPSYRTVEVLEKVLAEAKAEREKQNESSS